MADTVKPAHLSALWPSSIMQSELVSLISTLDLFLKNCERKTKMAMALYWSNISPSVITIPFHLLI